MKLSHALDQVASGDAGREGAGDGGDVSRAGGNVNVGASASGDTGI